MTTWLLHLISVSALAAFVWLLCLGLKNRPAWRHALWLVVLIKLVTPPLVAWPWSGTDIARYALPETKPVTIEEPDSEPSAPVFVPEPAEAEPDVAIPEIWYTAGDDRPAEGLPPVFAAEDPVLVPLTAPVPETEQPFVARSEAPVKIPAVISVEAQDITVTDKPAASTPVIAPETIQWTLNGLLGLWIAGSAVFLLVQLRRLLKQRAVVRRGEPPTRELIDEIERVSRALQMKPVRATVVREIASPFLWCLGRPKLAWPSTMSDDETLQQSRGIIAHELAHLRRRDHWVAWLELAAGVTWWWNPLFWFVRRRLRESAEMACDAVALSLYDERKNYAQLFLKLSTNPPTGVPAPVLGVSTGHSASIERRITMIMSDRVSGKMSGWGILAVICFAVVVLPSLSVGQDVPAKKPEAAPTSEEPVVASSPETSAKPAVAGEGAAENSFKAIDFDQDGEPDLVLSSDNQVVGHLFSVFSDTPLNPGLQGSEGSDQESFSKPEETDSAATDDRLPAETRTGSPTIDGPLVVESGKSDDLNGAWILTGPEPESSPLELYIQIFDTKNGNVTTFLKHRASVGASTNQFAIDTNHTPHQLTTYGDNVFKQSIFEVRGDKLRIARFSKANLARPRSFEDTHPEAGKLVVLQFQRMTQSSNPPPTAASQSEGAAGLDSFIVTSRGKPRAALMGQSQPSKAKPPRNPNQTNGSLGDDLLRSQTLPEIKVSEDEQLQKLQRRWLEMNVESAEAAHEVETKDYEFRVRLSKQGYVSPDELEQAQAGLRQKELQIERAKLLLQVFELHVNRMKESRPLPLELEP